MNNQFNEAISLLEQARTSLIFQIGSIVIDSPEYVAAVESKSEEFTLLKSRYADITEHCKALDAMIAKLKAREA